MNVKDYDIPLPEGDMLELIFSHQWELAMKYHPIEEKNLGYPLPDPITIDIQDRLAQLRLKEFAWRITEELSEATSCLSPHEVDEIHFLEEMVDALHFSVELCIMCRITPEDLIPEPTGDKLDRLMSDANGMSLPMYAHLELKDPSAQNIIRLMTWITIEKLGEAMNCLKNKPWKSTHMTTDKQVFKTHMTNFMYLFGRLMVYSGFDSISLAKIYLNKNAVNLFRIRSNY